MPSAVSKIIQIAVGADGGGTDRLYALTEDGEIWLYEGFVDPGWEQLPPPEPRSPREYVFRDRQEESA